MKVFEANISNQVLEFLRDLINKSKIHEIANQNILDEFGINIFL